MNLTYSLRSLRRGIATRLETIIFRKKHPDSIRNYKGKLIDKNTPFGILEAYRTVRTNLFYTGLMSKRPVIAVTSPMPHEGKSLSCANLAITFAMANKKVVIVDCDMRACAQQTILSIEEDGYGLSDYLSGQVDQIPLIQTSRERVSLIRAGHRPPNPTELLMSEHMQTLLDTLRSEFDIVFLDLPPVTLFSDASMLSSRVDGYLLIVESSHSTYDNTNRALQALESVNANIVGFVLNDVPQKGMRYGKYSYRGYDEVSEKREKRKKREKQSEAQSEKSKEE